MPQAGGVSPRPYRGRRQRRGRGYSVWARRRSLRRGPPPPPGRPSSRSPVGQRPDHPQVVADEQVGEAGASPAGRAAGPRSGPARTCRAPRWARPARRLGLQHHGARDGDALALAAREFVRVAVHGGGIEARPRRGRRRPLSRSSRGSRSWTPAPRAMISRHGQARGQRAVGVLEDDLHVAAQRPQRAAAQRFDVAAQEDDRPLQAISRSMARPSVVLPEPDSPTTPRVSPSRTASRRRPPPSHGRRCAAGRAGSGTRPRGRRPRAASGASAETGSGRPSARRRAACACRRAAGWRRPRARALLDDLARLHHATRSAMRRTMPRSWVMNSIAMPAPRLQVAQQRRGSAPAR